LKHRDIEYTIVQGLGRELWKWTVTINSMALRGQAATKSEAIADAERAIDRAQAPKQLRLVQPGRTEGPMVSDSTGFDLRTNEPPEWG
jgi:hypothetical protein